MQRIGSIYKKAVYRAYTDKTFTMPIPRGKREMHYGLAGPPIKAEVGDRVIVYVINRASRPYSFLANGVSITKENEGAFYKNKRYGKRRKNINLHMNNKEAFKVVFCRIACINIKYMYKNVIMLDQTEFSFKTKFSFLCPFPFPVSLYFWNLKYLFLC